MHGLRSVGTRVDLEHTEHLGKTVSRIAREKAGIIKPTSRAVTVAQSALPVIEARCRELHAPLTVVNRDVRAERGGSDWRGQDIRIRGSFGEIDVRTPLLGTFQVENVARAVRLHAESVSIPAVRDAIDASIRCAGSDDIILIAGSIYTAGEALDHLGVHP